MRPGPRGGCGTVLVRMKERRLARLPFVRPGPRMFSLSQYIIIGLAGSIYVAGAAFLLAGPPFLRDCSLLPAGTNSPAGTNGERAGGSRPAGGAPYFFPVHENRPLGHEDCTEPPLHAGGERTRTAPTAPDPDCQGSEPRTEKAERVLLTNPVCLN
jgi:hypothetical protein